MLNSLSPELRKWFALGTGLGIEIGPRDLHASVARVRPGGITILGQTKIENFRDRPASEWGTDLAFFARKMGVNHAAAMVLLPRREVIVRMLSLPGVDDDDLANAVLYQLDTLHPFGEDDAASGYANLGRGNILIGVAKRSVLETYQALFAEAGVKVASFSFSAAAAYASLRLIHDAPRNFFAFAETASGLEVYGESDAKPIFTALVDQTFERAAAVARAELRLPADTEPQMLDYWTADLSRTAAIAAACPHLAVQANLLPEASRGSVSKLRYVPTAVLALILAGLGGALAGHQSYEDKRLTDTIQAEIRRAQPEAAKVADLEKRTTNVINRTRTLDDFRRRSKRDMDALNEMTRTLAAPIWLNGFELTQKEVTVSGEADQAALLLKAIDSSPLFMNSEFTLPIARVQNGEAFRIKAMREEPAPPAAASTGAPK